MSAQQLERARQVRSSRRGSPLLRPIGVLMVAVAVVCAFDPDYPVPRSIPTAASAVARADLMPRTLVPHGVVDAASLRFRWTWTGAADATFELVLLDEQFDEVYRRPVRGNECAVDADLRAALRPAAESGQHLHWLVVAHSRDRQSRSAPVAFAFSR